ncbi:hypothetical protein AB7813_12855 [Tardiphaga sp. 20_F10_N6_6]|uniref:hypothetical protein n=1 Tax=Tardiphaga sp. 20_F10_N6_6 TaxID=3240788 RepID=UPI003F8BB9DE
MGKVAMGVRQQFAIVSMMIIYALSANPSCAEESKSSQTAEFDGFYVVARKQTAGNQCSAKRWKEGLPEITGAPAPQLKFSAGELQYYQGSVGCDIIRQRILKTNNFVGAGSETTLSLATDLKCYDEGTIGRKTVTWKLTHVGGETVLIELHPGFSPELWIKCTSN